MALVPGPSSEDTTSTWAARFAARRAQHGEVDVRGVVVDDATAADLGPSLATFQLGESGSGEHLMRAACTAGADDGYLAALADFVGEEQEHARLLADVLGEMGHPLRTSHWTDRFFVAVRRLHSLRTEVLVLMVAEVVALTYYGTLRDGIRDARLADVFGRIHDDEVVHVDFHCETLPAFLSRFPGPIHWLARIAWNVLVTGASIVVAIDHRRVLARCGRSPIAFVRSVAVDRASVDSRLFAR